MKMKNNKKIAPLRSVRMTGMRSVIESKIGYGVIAASISSTKTFKVGNGDSNSNFNVENNAELTLSGEADLVHAICHNKTWYGNPNFRLSQYEEETLYGYILIERFPKLENTLKLKDGEYINEITVGYSESFSVIYYLEFKTNQGNSIRMRPELEPEFSLFSGDIYNLKDIKVTNIAVGGDTNVEEFYFYNCLENISFTYTKG
jgi:hypothetical protein